MRVPSFKEISIDASDNPEDIEQNFLEHDVGHVPLYIKTDHLTEDQFYQVLFAISRVLNKLEIHPHFPYPVYLVTSYIKTNDFLPVVESISDLPQHFFLKSKRVRNKEFNLLNKVIILFNKVCNIPINQKYSELQYAFKSQRKLYELTREFSFLEQINNELN